MNAPRFQIADLAAWIELRFDPASGPGGQHVNKVSTRATLLLDFENCPSFSASQRLRIAQRLGTRLAHDGRLRVVAQSERSQTRNIAVAEERLIDLLTRAVQVPKTRRPTRPTAGSQRRRLQTKLRRGQIKQGRRGPPSAED